VFFSFIFSVVEKMFFAVSAENKGFLSSVVFLFHMKSGGVLFYTAQLQADGRSFVPLHVQ